MDDAFICDLNDGEYHEYSDGAEQLANARLIAAAPELLSVVRDLLQVIDDNPNAAFGELMLAWRISCDGEKSARAAVAKATGSSSAKPAPDDASGTNNTSATQP